MILNGQRSNQHQGSLNRTSQADSLGIWANTNWKISKKYPARQCTVCTAQKKQSETTYICKFCIVLLHKVSCYEKYHSIRNCQPLFMKFLQYWGQEYHLYSQLVSKNILRSCTLKCVKCPKTGGIWLKGHLIDNGLQKTIHQALKYDHVAGGGNVTLILVWDDRWNQLSHIMHCNTTWHLSTIPVHSWLLTLPL